MDKKEIENQAMQNDESRCILAIRASKTAVWDLNIHTNKLYIDPILSTLLGYESTHIINSTDDWIKYIHPLDRDRVKDQIQKHLNGIIPEISIEHRMLEKCGKYRWFLLSGKLIDGAENHSQRMVGTIVATNRENYELIYGFSDEKYFNILENANEGIIIIQNNQIKYVNKRFEDITGYPVKDIIGSAAINHIAPEYRRMVMKRYHKALNDHRKMRYGFFLAKKPKSYEIEIISSKKRRIPLEMSFSNIQYENKPAVVMTLKDITLQKSTQEALKLSEERLSLVLESSNFGIWDWSINDGKIMFDQKLADIINHNLIGLEAGIETCKQFLHPDDIPELRSTLDNHFKKLDPYFVKECRILTQTVEWKWILVQGKVVEWSRKGYPLRMVGTIGDITQRKLAEEELKRSKNELSKAYDDLKSLDRMKDQLISNISHELRTPLVSIIGYNELICEEELGSLNTQQKKAVSTALENARRLKKLIDSLLYLNIMDIKNFTYEVNNIQLKDIVCEIISDMSMHIEKKDISVQTEIPASLPAIRGNKEQLALMIFNLLDNAIKFTPSGGSINVRLQDNIDEIHISIKDTGIGIPKKMIPNIFRLFYQIDASSNRRYSGTGLGMYICKTIADSHNGKIIIDSEENKGTTVTVILPKTAN